MTPLSDVNTTDLVGAIELGCQTMGRVFNADDDDIPFFAVSLLPKARMDFNWFHSESHVPGRHLNALLTAESVVGINIPEEVIAKHAAAAMFSYNGPIPLPLNRDKIGGTLSRFLPHNLREGMHALYALTRYRSSEEARLVAEASIQATRKFWKPRNDWDTDALNRIYGVTLIPLVDTFIVGIARMIGPLVKYHAVTGCDAAMDLALTLKNELIQGYFLPDGSFDSALFGSHTHSTTCVLSSLAQLADFTDDMDLFALVQAFYDNGLNELRDEIGWSIENCSLDSTEDRGESNNTGDIVETALILGRRVDPRYFHDAERIIRSHLLPSQLRDISFVPDGDGGDDGARDVGGRMRGAFGFPAPYGHRPLDSDKVPFNLDIVGGAVASLCEAARETVTYDGSVHHVNMLFDIENEDIRVTSPYVDDGLRITLKRPGNLRVLLPSWADASNVWLDGNATAWQVNDNHIEVIDPKPGLSLIIRIPMPEQEIVLHHRTRDFTARLHGDEVVAMENHGADLVFFRDF